MNANNHIWFPYTQMENAPAPLKVIKGEGLYLYLEDGRKIIDGISSWWTCLHGHCHPQLMEALRQQTTKLDHVIFAGFTHQPAEDLASELVKIAPWNDAKVFYSDNGSTAVEIAIKMAIQYQINTGNEHKTKIATLQGGFHGETFGSMALAGKDGFFKPFKRYLFEVVELDVFSDDFEKQLEEAFSDGDIAAFIYEPLLMGTSGMRIYPASKINQIIDNCQKHGALAIADEVLTGFGRTGSLMASDQVELKPDIICLAKGLTGGVMPLAVTLATPFVYQAFLGKDLSNALLHGHSYTANPLSCAVALENLKMMQTPEALSRIQNISAYHRKFAPKIQAKFGERIHVRFVGTVMAIELQGIEGSYFNPIRTKIYDYFLANGILMRPLGNVFYLLPPYCITTEELDFVYEKIISFLHTHVE